jgi:hypothetical protein
MTIVMLLVKMMKLPPWPERKAKPLTWRTGVSLGALEMAPKLILASRELRCERVFLNASGLLFCKDILAPSGLRIL